MHIMCIGDSLGLPRENVKYIGTWPYLLKKRFPNYDFILSFTRSCTTKALKSIDALELYPLDIVIIHLGIVDCAPRYINRIVEEHIIRNLPIRIQKVFWLFWKATHRRRERKAYVSPEGYYQNISNYIERCMRQNLKKIILIKIVTPGQAMIKGNPLIVRSVVKYNQCLDILKEKYPFIEIVESICGDDMFIEDGYHLNEKGNKAIFEKVNGLIHDVY